MPKPRYRIYREHKYLFFVFTEFLRQLATVNLTDAAVRADLVTEVENLNSLLKGHAAHEEHNIHSLLHKKGVGDLVTQVEAVHASHGIFLEGMITKINQMAMLDSAQEIHAKGYELYLNIRNFFAENLLHFREEEELLMPALQSLYSDEELREIDRESYRQMSVEELQQMLEVLFPHMNGDDKECFLKDIRDAVPEKFEVLAALSPA